MKHLTDSHDDLIEACRKALAFIRRLQRNYPSIPMNSDSGLDWDTELILRDALAEAALVKAAKENQ